MPRDGACARAAAVSIYQAMKALRVLVIEDDALIALLLSELLAGMGHDVCATATTEAEAVSAATRCNPDLMIVDARLGQGSGVSAVEEIAYPRAPGARRGVARFPGRSRCAANQLKVPWCVTISALVRASLAETKPSRQEMPTA